MAQAAVGVVPLLRYNLGRLIRDERNAAQVVAAQVVYYSPLPHGNPLAVGVRAFGRTPLLSDGRTDAGDGIRHGGALPDVAHPVPGAHPEVVGMARLPLNPAEVAAVPVSQSTHAPSPTRYCTS